MQPRREDRNLLLGCLCISGTAPHSLWDIWGVLLTIMGIQASDKLSLMLPLAYRGENPSGVWLSCPLSVPGAWPGVPGGKKEEGGERAWERGGKQRPWSWEGVVIGILGAEKSPVAGQPSRPTSWHQAAHSSARARPGGPLRSQQPCSSHIGLHEQ